MGLGYLYNGKRKILGGLLTLAAIGLTYFENIYIFPDGNTLLDHDAKAFMILFACVLIANIGLAIDAFQEAKDINSKNNL